MAPIFQLLLNEAPKEAVQLARSWHEFRNTSRNRWAEAATESPQCALQRAKAVQIPDLDTLGSFLRKERHCGIVLTTIHMGDYLAAILSILLQCGDRPVLIVRRKNASNVEDQAFSKLADLGVNYSVVRTIEKSAALRIVRGLKHGAVVVSLFDLPQRFGDTSCVNLFNQRIHWVNGPAICAAMGDALLVPFFTYQESAEARCDIWPVISMRRGIEIQLIMQSLAIPAENYIKRYPAQWMQWNSIGEMLEGDG